MPPARDGRGGGRGLWRLMREADAALCGRFTDYETTVANWAGAFGRDRLLILRHEDVGRDAAGAAAAVCEFLEIRAPRRRMARAIEKRPNRSKSAPVPVALRRHLARVWLPRTRRFAASSGLDMGEWITAMEREAAAATPSQRLASLAERLSYELPLARGLHPLARTAETRRRARAARRTLAPPPAAPAPTAATPRRPRLTVRPAAG